MNNKFIKQRKFLIILAVTVGFILVLVVVNENITKVSAQIVPILVHEEHLDFGTVFPGEGLQGDFTVYYVEEYEQEGITYRIIKKRKPLPEGHPELPNGGDPEMPGFYRDLCSFLTPVNVEGEGDTTSSASVGSDDLSDVWTIDFEVPAIIGHISQDHIGGVVTSNGEYGCDISIDITEAFVIDTIIVPSDGSVVNSSVTLENGEQYLLEASGTYEYWPAQLPDAGIADAKCSLRPEGSSNPGPGPKWISGDTLPSPWTNYLEVWVDDAPMAWGTCSGSHIYSISYAGNGSTINFKILDDYYSDNSGSITVKIYQLP